jgi:hypothetical protein
MNYLDINEITLELPDHMIAVKPFSIKSKSFDELADKFTAARIKSSSYGKLEPKKDESRDEYTARFAKYLEEKNKPKDGELAAEYVDRVMEPIGYKDNSGFLKSLLIATLDTVGGGQGFRITDETYKELAPGAVIVFIKSICRFGLLEVPELPNLI